MEFAEIKKAVIDYASAVDTASKSITSHFSAIANVKNDMIALEDKWTKDTVTIESAINSIPDDAVKASYVGQFNLLKAQRLQIVAMLEALDTAVTEAGLMLI